MTTQRTKYEQLQPEDRVRIASLRQHKLRVRAIAPMLSSELKRNGRTAPRPHQEPHLPRVTQNHLHPAVRAALGRAAPRQHHSKRLPRTRGKERRGQIPDMVSIHVRPPEIEDRVLPGHWEGDFIKGAGNKSSVRVLVERSSRLVLLAKMDDATSASALAGFTAKLNSIAEPMRQSFTYDQGREMACHAELSAAIGVKIYFCDPHSPWQRGTCENTNGLLRQYLPKGTDLSVHSQEELNAIADGLNNQPRATHGFYSPLVAYERMLKQLQTTPDSVP